MKSNTLPQPNGAPETFLNQFLPLYPYYQHRDFGRMHGRVQSGFPFPVEVGLNGRHCTERGRRLITALVAARNANVDQLTQLAA